MNQHGAQGGSQAPGPASNPPMYKPEMMRNLTMLKQEDREKYEQGLRQLWDLFDRELDGSPGKLAAQKKIQDFGRILLGKLQNMRAQNAQNQKPQPKPVAQGPPPQGAAGQQALPNQIRPPVGQPHAQAPGPGAPAGPVEGAAGPSATAPGQPQPNPLQTGAKIPDSIIAHVRQMPFIPPPQITERGPEVVQKWKAESKRRYTAALLQMDNAKQNITKINQTIRERQEKGVPIPPEEIKLLGEKKSKTEHMYQEASRVVEQFRKQQELYRAQAAAAANPGTSSAAGGSAGATQTGGGGPAGQQPTLQQIPQQPPQQQSQAPSQQSQPAAQGNPQAANMSMQNSQANINGAFEAAKNQQIAAAMPRPPGQGMPGMPGAGQSLSQPPQVGSTLSSAAPSTSPVTQAPAPAVGQVQIKIEPGIQQQQPLSQPQPLQHPPQAIPHGHPQPQPQHHPHQHPHQQPPQPPPVNTALASTVAVGSVPSAGTPTTRNPARVQTPQSATVPPGAGRPLTHQAAISLANRHSSGSIPQQGQPQQGANGGGSVGGTPNSAGGAVPAASTPQGISHPHAHPTATTQGGQLLHQKAPINRSLPEKLQQPPQPVTMTGGLGAGRPTITGGGAMAGGVMAQPVLPKQPNGGVHTEAEGDRVLNKKKLDELVRQVCGGPADGHDGNVLTPDVEESVLNLADSFVDNVLHAACRNAKERGSKVLEIRDIQLVLERTYNIRIPGYSADELRTVRKVQPSSAWISKMSAVQAAKVMPGKGDL